MLPNVIFVMSSHYITEGQMFCRYGRKEKVTMRVENYHPLTQPEMNSLAASKHTK